MSKESLINIKVNNLEKGTNIIGAFYIKAVEEKVTSRNKPFLDLILVNKHGEYSSKVWENADSRKESFVEKSIIYVNAIVDEWQGQKQLNIIKEKTPDDNEITVNDLILSSRFNPETMFEEINSEINNITNEDIRKITSKMWLDNKDKLLYYGGAKMHHHNTKSGLLEHIYTMFKAALHYTNIHPKLNKDLLISGVVIHDLGKLKELNADDVGLIVDYSIEGELLGHLAIGIQDIALYSKELNIDPYISNLLSHMVLSHHGKPEYGSIRYPMFIEAELLYYLDAVDCKIFMFDNLTSQLNENEFSNRKWELDNRKLFNLNI